MSKLKATEPVCTRRDDSVPVLIRARSRDLGGFSVRRVLPAVLARRVGPFVFFDEMGPADFPPGQGINVRPHPHIGLSTVTFLFEGEILHRDSLGYVQAIQPGAVNLMTAGHGIVHSERTDPRLLHSGQRLHGLQVWMALPSERQDIEPDFLHYPKESLPDVTVGGVSTTVIIGRFQGVESPVRAFAKTIYLVQRLEAGEKTEFDPQVEQAAIYLVSGNIEVNRVGLEVGMMAILRPGVTTIRAHDSSQIIVIGGEDIGPRHIDWNFVHTSSEAIEEAKRRWRDGKFRGVPGDDEFIPLPND